MNRKPSYVKALFIALTLICCILSWRYPLVSDKESEIMVNEAIETIREVSQHPHSFRDSLERQVVADFLFSSLEKHGSPTYYCYDSILTRIGTFVTGKNIFVRINPPHPTDSTAYLLLIAHYDSTGKPTPEDSARFSFGAADNGYGLGVILSVLTNVSQDQKNWKQGLCILFTDLEEEYTAGMKKALSENPEIFRNVNMAINIDARGTKGPALLFEVSKGNIQLLDLYKQARYPYSYSLTSLVYGLMPNYTDFGCIRDTIPGMSFAVIDDLDKYHTYHDNFSNISPEAIRHYLAQITPMVREYLKKEKYQDQEWFRCENNQLYFTIPFIGFIRVSNITWRILNWASFCLFLFTLFIFYQRYKFRIKLFLLKVGALTGMSILVFIIGTGLAWTITRLFGQKFELTHTLNIPTGIPITIIFILACILFMYIRWRMINNAEKRREWELALYGFLNIEAMLSFLLFTDNFFFLIPALSGTTAFLVSLLPKQRWIWFVAPMPVLLTEVAFLKQLYFALTFGILGILSFISIPCLLLIVLMYEKGTHYSKKKLPE